MLSTIKHLGIHLNKYVRYQHFYTRTHEVINVISKDTVRIGPSNYAKETMGDIVFIEVNEVDNHFDKDEEIVTIESVKATSSINAPADGTIISHNEELIDDTDKIINKSELDSWLLEYKLDNKIDTDMLLNSQEYNNFLENSITK